MLKGLSALCVVAGAIVVAGCGGSGDRAAPRPAPPVEQRTLESAPQPEPAHTAGDAPRPGESGDASASASQRERLEAAGYDVIQSRVAGLDPSPRAALELPLHGGARLTVFLYGSARDARAKAREFRPLERQAPKYARLAVKGSTVYFALSEDADATVDRAEFDDVVRIAEGG